MLKLKTLVKSVFIVPFVFFGQTMEIKNIKDSIAKEIITEKFIFCEMISTKNIFGNHEEFNFDYGNIDELYSEKIHLIKPSVIKKQKKLIDVFNIMGIQGWELTHSYSTSKNSYIKQHYVFQKKILIKN